MWQMQEHLQLADEAAVEAEDYCSHLAEQVAVLSPVTLSSGRASDW